MSGIRTLSPKSSFYEILGPISPTYIKYEFKFKLKILYHEALTAGYIALVHLCATLKSNRDKPQKVYIGVIRIDREDDLAMFVHPFVNSFHGEGV